MKRTSLTLTDEIAGALEREARRRDLSVSEVVRQALAKHLGIGRDEPRSIPFAALGRSGHRTTGRDFEDVLAEEWSPDRDR
jgi:Arc/MetJ-type ribon-helix-helix transcriptional regulator